MPKKPHNIHFEQPIVVKVNRRQRRNRMLAVVVLLISLPIATYFVTSWFLGEDNRRLKVKTAEQTEIIAALRAEIEYLDQLRSNAEIAAEVDKTSMNELRTELVVMSNNNEVLSEQLQFYQSLMDPNPTNAGVYIESVDLLAGAEPQHFQYRILIAQKSANHRKISGHVLVEVLPEGAGNEDEVLRLSQLGASSDRLVLGFKFFQPFSGDLMLPEGFTPAKIRVIVQLSGDQGLRLNQTFDWPSLL